jgi:hypothetical protein
MTGAVTGADAEAAAITADLRAAGTPERAVSEKAYLKSDLEFFGASVPIIRSAVRSWRRSRPALGHDELVAVAAALWERPVHEWPRVHLVSGVTLREALKPLSAETRNALLIARHAVDPATQ